MEFTNSNILICFGIFEENIVLNNCNSIIFEHNNMFSKYDWYLKNMTFDNSTSWIWIASARYSSKLKTWTGWDSDPRLIELIFNKKPKTTSLTWQSSSRPKTWQTKDTTNWTSSLKMWIRYGKKRPSSDWPSLRMLDKNLHRTSVLQLLYTSAKTDSFIDSPLLG